jgi:serine/threonine protein kinase
MSDHGTQRLLDLCQEALAREAGADRDAFLDQACGGDAALRRAVEELLQEQAGLGTFMDAPAWTAAKRLAEGARLGPYEIQAFIGAGGMGEVYKARDTRLQRTVAIKVLPPEPGAGSSAAPGSPAARSRDERRARFEREARTIAGLNHPHICALYDVGREADTDFLVMEFLAGETLSDRIRKGPLPLDEALALAAQIAGALASAHRQGIVHRDLKPGNVMLTKSGAKLLDFGLAKLRRAAVAPAASASSTMRTTEPLTAEGLILGTVPYMSPEQVEGKEADARTDVFAFGAVLYEMLTGTRAFAGDSQASIITAIMASQPPPVSSVQPVTPPALDRLVAKCLAKDPERRWQTTDDLADELGWLATDSGLVAASGERGVVSRSRRLPWPAGLFAAAALFAGVVVGALIWRSLAAPATPVAPPERIHISLADTGLTPAGGLAVSRDGQTIVFGATAGDDTPGRLYVRRLRDWQPTALAGTDVPKMGFCLVPDGSAVTFMTPKGLYRVPLDGGAPVVIQADDRQGKEGGISCASDGSVIFSMNVGSRLWRIPATGGRPEAIDRPGELEAGARYTSAQMLPGGQAVIFTKNVGGRSVVAVFSLRSRKTTVVVDGATRPRFLPATGHLVYLMDRALIAMRFNPDTLERGEPYTLAADVGAWDISPTTFAYVPLSVRSRLTWKDRRGGISPLPIAIPHGIHWMALSPEGRRAVLTLMAGPAHQVYLADLDSDAAPLRLTRGDDDWFGVFTPDGRRVLFTSGEGGPARYNIFSTPADGSGAPVRQTDSPGWQKASAVRHTDAADLFLYNNQRRPARETGAVTADLDAMDIWQQNLDAPASARALIATPGRKEIDAAFSPDGRWVAYVSDESGRADVEVKGYPDGPRAVVSPDGGRNPVWNPKTGAELFYQNATTVFAVTIVNGRRVGPPRRVFECPPGGERSWDVAPDGERFLVVDVTRPVQINLVTNWLDELKAKERVRR